MLAPEKRQIYLEEIQPPVGYELDRAVATTYSLDLLSLLMTPLSLALFSADSLQEIWNNPAAVTEALRKTSDKLTVFCQQGQIKVPKKDNKLFNYLEPIVHDVQPPGNNGVFHPKIWVLRFTGEDCPPFYRFLCLSRNLTFDNSWDTVLSLEGKLREDRVNAFARNHPLGDFITRLPELAVTEVSDRVKSDIELVAEEIRRVEFVTPDPFEDYIEFIPLGIGKRNNLEELTDYTNMLVVSPFLSFASVNNLFSQDKDNYLISRGETLDQLTEEESKEIMNKASTYIMDQAAERPEAENFPEEKTDAFGEDLSGLHAKLFILEKGWDARIFTGSANATKAGMTGKNVEFMVGLKGKKCQVGIEPFFGDEEADTSVFSMLKNYQITGEEKSENKVQKRLEQQLQQMQNQLSRLKLKVEITSQSEDYSLIIRPRKKITGSDLKVKGKCYPITLKNDKKDISSLLSGEPILYSEVSLAALTGFVAFELEAEMKGNTGKETASTSFVFNLPVKGMPEKRDKKILQEIISSRERFMQYLLILLSEDNSIFSGLKDGFTRQGQGNSPDRSSIDFPLLEELVKAFSRNPDRLKRVRELVEDLTETEAGREILPNNFNKIWSAFCELDTGNGVDNNDCQT